MIRGATLEAFPEQCGIMAHANVSNNVKQFVRDFPASSGFYHIDETRESRAEYEDESKYVVDPETGELTALGEQIRSQTVRICDSGVFTKNGSDFESYPDLYERYEEMAVDYGIIIDELNDPDATIEAAREAITAYEQESYSFDLIGVSQGTTPAEYMECYDTLREMGYSQIAVGGLLEQTGDRGGAFANVSDDRYMERVLRELRSAYPDDWLFALGCHHPTRRALFEELDLFGADYKGWIYKYTADNDRGTVEARNWRYRNVRSFIRNSILTDAWIPPRDDLSLESTEKSHLLVVVPQDGTLPETVGTREVGGILSAPGATDMSVEQLVEGSTEAGRTVGMVYTAGTGLVPLDFQLDVDGGVHRSLPSDRREAVAIDVAKFLQYRDIDRVTIVGAEDTAVDLVAVFREEAPEEVQIRSITGSPGERAAALAEGEPSFW